MKAYNADYAAKAQAYVDKLRDDEVHALMQYYLNPEHPCRRHEYTELVLEALVVRSDQMFNTFITVDK